MRGVLINPTYSHKGTPLQGVWFHCAQNFFCVVHLRVHYARTPLTGQPLTCCPWKVPLFVQCACRQLCTCSRQLCIYMQ